MADFAECAEMISRCMGNADGLFVDAYYENITLQTEEVLNTSAVASALLKLMNDRKEWNGNATELLEQLDQIIGDKASKNKYWPKTASVLSRRINEVKTNVREVGIFIKEGPQDPVTRVKTIMITKPSDIGKMPFEQFEPFDRRGESQNNDDRHPSAVARDAIEYAAKHAVQVALVDTAGRMNNSSPLMNELNRVVRVTKPDMKIFICDALTGNDAIEKPSAVLHCPTRP